MIWNKKSAGHTQGSLVKLRQIAKAPIRLRIKAK
jgi:hypothetical protein